MRCNICDKELSDKEVNYNEDLQGYEPCTECLDVAMDAAYSGSLPDDDRELVAVDSSFDEMTPWSNFFATPVDLDERIGLDD